MLTALDHVVVGVGDLSLAAQTYARLLGRRPSWSGEHPTFGTRNVLFELENTCLELLAPARDGSLSGVLRARLEQEGEGLLALAFRTADAGACAALLRERGLSASDPQDGEGREAGSGTLRRFRNVWLPASETRGVALFAIERCAVDGALPRALPDAAVEASVSALDHVVVMGADADAARALYGDQLGLRLALDRVFEARRLHLLFFRVGGVTVEIAVPLDAEPKRAAGDRLYGLSWRVPDVAAARARLAAAGFEVSEVRSGMKPGTRVCSVRRETHGVATLLIGPDPDASGSGS